MGRNVSIGDDMPTLSYTTSVRDQFLPKWCGSCWAHAAAAAMGARRKIHVAGQGRDDVDISVQNLVNCVTEDSSRGCDGGGSYGANVYAFKKGAVDSSCLAYTAETHKCDGMGTCQQHLSSKGDAKAVTPI